jgi:hypothetical protein
MKELEKPGIGTEEAKDMELEEEPRPVRKAQDASVPVPDETNEKKRKGKRKV